MADISTKPENTRYFCKLLLLSFRVFCNFAIFQLVVEELKRKEKEKS